MGKELLPSVLANEKKIGVTNGLCSETKWDERLNNTTPLKKTLVSVRGTISNALKDAIKKDPLKINAEVQKANLQQVENCYLQLENDTLVLNFSVKILSGLEKPCSCNDQKFLKLLKEKSALYFTEEKYKEIGIRYAYNIANGRFFWRNRLSCEKIEVRVKTGSDNFVFNSLDLSLQNFDNPNDNVIALGEIISSALKGDKPFLLLNVTAYALVGCGQEVFPSQELTLDSKSDISKILYDVNGVAAMHPQKISNAIRTIDTWFPAYKENLTPIAIEPYGAVTNLGIAYRIPKDKTDFYSVFKKFIYTEDPISDEEVLYIMGILIRGGVFGESSKK